MPALVRIFIFTSFVFCSNAQTDLSLTIDNETGTFCQDLPVTFTLREGDSLSDISWSITPSKGWKLQKPAVGSKTIGVIFSTPSVYTIAVNAFDTAERNGRITVQVFRSPTAAFNASLTETGFPARLILTNYSSNYNALVWRFSDGGTDSSLHLNKNITGSGPHEVDLIAFGVNGCNDTSRYAFFVDNSSEITLPNIFTPNNDGVNDVYRPVIKGISQLKAMVFSREQLMVHSWEKVNGFWDGRTTSGELCADGVYFIAVEATGFDQKKYSINGTITLLR